MTLPILRSGWLICPPLLWALNTELGQIVPYADCAANVPRMAAFAILLTVTAVIASLLPLRLQKAGTAMTSGFITWLGVLVGLSFSFAIGLQSAAAILVSSCQR